MTLVDNASAVYTGLFTEDDVLNKRLPTRAAPESDAGALYILEFTSGLIKVGRSAAPLSRIGHHMRNVRLYANGRLVRGWLSPAHQNYIATERELIARGAAMADAVEGSEYLFGASFDQLLKFAQSLDCAAPCKESALLRCYQPFTVPELLQTLDYAQAIIPGEPDHRQPIKVQSLTKSRLDDQVVLDSGNAAFEFLIGDDAFLSIPRREVMPGQVAHLKAAMLMPAVTIGIVPARETMGHPSHNFTLHGARGRAATRVTIRAVHQRLDERTRSVVGVYEREWKRLQGVALFGQDAIDRIHFVQELPLTDLQELFR